MYFAPTLSLCVLYGCHNKQLLLHYVLVTVSFIGWKSFALSVREEWNSCTKFRWMSVFKGVKQSFVEVINMLMHYKFLISFPFKKKVSFVSASCLCRCTCFGLLLEKPYTCICVYVCMYVCICVCVCVFVRHSRYDLLYGYSTLIIYLLIDDKIQRDFFRQKHFNL